VRDLVGVCVRVSARVHMFAYAATRARVRTHASVRDGPAMRVREVIAVDRARVNVPACCTAASQVPKSLTIAAEIFLRSGRFLLRLTDKNTAPGLHQRWRIVRATSL